VIIKTLTSDTETVNSHINSSGIRKLTLPDSAQAAARFDTTVTVDTLSSWRPSPTLRFEHQLSLKFIQDHSAKNRNLLCSVLIDNVLVATLEENEAI
jgi:hypothetical protein